jgi:hypothetical protein
VGGRCAAYVGTHARPDAPPPPPPPPRPVQNNNSWMGHAAVVDALLDAGVAANTADAKSGWTPLHFAAR